MGRVISPALFFSTSLSPRQLTCPGLVGADWCFLWVRIRPWRTAVSGVNPPRPAPPGAVGRAQSELHAPYIQVIHSQFPRDALGREVSGWENGHEKDIGIEWLCMKVGNNQGGCVEGK